MDKFSNDEKVLRQGAKLYAKICTEDDMRKQLRIMKECSGKIKADPSQGNIEELKDLLKKQGKLNTDIKDIRALKKRLMDEIVEQMNEMGSNMSKKAEKKLNDNKRLIEECNEKLQEYGDDVYDIPKKINEVNYKLMLETMEICYEQIQENNDEIESISKWVDEMRVELKKKVVQKQQKLKKNQNFYTYMHNIFGAEVINIFDMKYNVEPLTNQDTVKDNKEKSE